MAQIGDAHNGSFVRARQAARVPPLLVLLAVACSGDPAGPKAGDARGTFTATLTGAVRATLTGAAAFVAQEGQGYEVEMLPQHMTNVSGLWVGAGKGRPALGEYSVTPVTVPQTLPTVLVRYCANTPVACYTDWGAYWETSAGAGRLVITQSTATTLAGTLDVDLRTPGTSAAAAHSHACRRASTRPAVSPPVPEQRLAEPDSVKSPRR
jgi:hypothetical protein